jgi:hypothetical protein
LVGSTAAGALVGSAAAGALAGSVLAGETAAGAAGAHAESTNTTTNNIDKIFVYLWFIFLILLDHVFENDEITETNDPALTKQYTSGGVNTSSMHEDDRYSVDLYK